MTLDAEAIVDRRRLKRRLSLWRLLAIVAGVAAVVGIILASGERGGLLGRSHIAALNVDGLITGERDKIETIRKIARSSAARALIVRIDSPGGTTAGSEALYQELRAVAAKKPVVAVMETVAASGGYIAALAADRIVARGNTITGSIGVIFQWAEVKQALDSLGIKVDEIKSGPLKASPSLFAETPPEARAVTEAMVRDGYEWFVGLVAERRPFDAGTARTLSDGRVYTGRQALAARLIDEIGGEKEARTWLETEKGLPKGLNIVDWTEENLAGIDLVSRALAYAANALGLPAPGGAGLGLATGVGAPQLDGLLSLWHPRLIN